MVEDNSPHQQLDNTNVAQDPPSYIPDLQSSLSCSFSTEFLSAVRNGYPKKKKKEEGRNDPNLLFGG